ncbi:hypothetical protein [Micromonospora sp. NBC_01412]|uniref:hypothetical protein n=1 Tax=Micromonospora sp. NBC_01412 TaxID=2903590 RepID=UPI00324357F2
MTTRWVLFAVGVGLFVAGLAVFITAIWVDGWAGVYFLGFPLAIAGGMITGKALRIGMPGAA